MTARTRMVGFFLVDAFSMMSFASAFEALRQANRLAGFPAYHWYTCSSDGNPVCCSAGLPVAADHALDSAPRPDLMLVVSATARALPGEHRLHARLRAMAHDGSRLGAVTYGAWLLARAGLLDHRRCTVHWESLDAFRETFPALVVTGDLFEMDGDRYTCSGGTASLDMMLHVIAREQGEEFAAGVADQFLHQRIRQRDEHQRVPLRRRIGVSHPKLLRYVELLEDDREPARSQRQLADEVGLSSRQLERLFRKYLDTTPSRYSMDHRLRRARSLLRNSSLSIIDVAMACGFTSHSHFSKSYRERFGAAPRDDRGHAQRLQAPVADA